MNFKRSVPVESPSTDERIVVEKNEYGVSISYRDPNPLTRYRAPRLSFWERVKEDWRLGGVAIPDRSANLSD